MRVLPVPVLSVTVLSACGSRLSDRISMGHRVSASYFIRFSTICQAQRRSFVNFSDFHKNNIDILLNIRYNKGRVF
jgi:hypothetical protein